MTDVRVRELFESTLDSAPPARFDLDSAMRSGRRRRRTRTAAVLGSSALVVVLAGSLVASVAPRFGSDPAVTGPVASSPSAASLPRGVVGTGPWAYAVPLVPATARGEQTTAAPELGVWIDPQCPACAAFHRAAADTIAQLVDEGVISVYYRPATFIDDAVADENAAAGAPRSSRRAVAAWGCAIDQGFGRVYLTALMTGQPASEGDGFTDARLDELARVAGLDGDALARFTACRGSERYLAWADAAERAFEDAKVPGTPTITLDGRDLPVATAADPAALRAAVLEAAARTA
jgi:protein-disulfide isomerase